MQNTSFYIFKWYFFLPFLSLLLFGFSGLSQAAQSDAISAFPTDSVSFFVVKTELPVLLNCTRMVRSQAEQMECSIQKIMSFFSQHLQYPAFALRDMIEGRIRVYFKVAYDGRIEAIGVEEYLGGGCIQEVMRLLRLFQTQFLFTPQKAQGPKLKIIYKLDIVFSIETNR